MTNTEDAMKLGRFLGLGALAIVIVNYAPETLAFPYHRQIGRFSVYSEVPLGPRLPLVLKRAEALVDTGPLPDTKSGRRLFLTDRGMRWRVLSLASPDAFGLTRPLSTAIVLNRSDVAADSIMNGRAVGGRRTLSGVIAHEMVHGLLVEHFGPLRMALAPNWKVEGFADYVARESSLDDATATRLRGAGENHPALVYYDGHRKVAAAFAGGATVDSFFAD